MILVMVWTGGTASAGVVAFSAPVRERVVISGTSRMMLEAQMLVMVFSSRLLAGRTALATNGGDEGAVSISSVFGYSEDRLKTYKTHTAINWFYSRGQCDLTCESWLALYAASAFKYSFLAASVFLLYT